MGNANQTSFKHYDFNDGLSANLVNSIYQDSTGFVWFGTKNGLNRFDGFNFKHYPFVPADSNTISGQEVTSIISVSVDELWVGTETGLNKLNPVTGVNQRYFQRDNDENSLLWNYILCLYVSKNNELFIGTSLGICKYLPESNNFDRLPNVNEKISGKSTFIDRIEEDENGNIWFLAGGIHLVQMNPSLEQVVSVNTIPGEVSHEQIRNDFTIVNGRIVIGSRNDIVTYLPQQREFKFWNLKGIPNSSELYATAIVNNDDHTLYFGTTQSGMLKVNINTQKIE
ncbi:hypothetical protein OAO55_03710, partial [Bacteroidales bacterium]|nr:hypothetical protein [Bacteroidales bacterium]